MHFGSDNTSGAAPEIIEALAKAAGGYSASYGSDEITKRVEARLAEIFECELSAFLVATGTAANSLALSTYVPPHRAVLCHEESHIHVDECGAPEFFTHGAKLVPVGGEAGRITRPALEEALTFWSSGGVHRQQPALLSLTQQSEAGTLYSLDELRSLSALAHEKDMAVHMDGARFANAAAALGCTPAEMTWRAGIDAVSFGGTKNGCLGVEAVIFFNPENAWEFELRRKRSAHLFSKHRYLSAQMLGYVTADAWRDAAQIANAHAARLAEGLRTVPGAEMVHNREVNMIFARLPRATHRRLRAAGAAYALYEGPLDAGPDEEPLMARFVCDWSVGEDEIDRFLEMAAG
jgi:threonine aldolase